MSEIKFINQYETDKKFTYDERIALLRKRKVAQTEEKARNGGANEDDYGLIVQNEFNYKLKPNHENGFPYACYQLPQGKVTRPPTKARPP